MRFLKMKKILPIWLLIFCLITCSYSFASATEELVKRLNSVKTMTADFTQTIYDNRQAAIQTSHGNMALQRPGKFRWKVTQPIPQLIIAKDTVLWIYDPDLEQVTIRSLSKASGETPALLLSHANTVLEKDFNVKTLASDTHHLEWFELLPKHSDSMFASIKMGFLNQQIKEMKLEDHLGHTTLIEFNRIKLNMAIADSLFTLKPPKGVDVIDETRPR